MATVLGQTYMDMFSMTDCFMNDHSADSHIMLDELGVEEDQRSNCNAHIILASDIAIDKVFRDMETRNG